VQKVYFRRQAQKPYYPLTLAILEPSRFAGHVISSRVYCNPKALWKLNGFLRDFGYDTELIGRDRDDRSGLKLARQRIKTLGEQDAVKISHIVINDASRIRLDGFAPAGRWEVLSPVVPRQNSDDQWVSAAIRRIS
jgi:hypothetical protein